MLNEPSSDYTSNSVSTSVSTSAQPSAVETNGVRTVAATTEVSTVLEPVVEVHKYGLSKPVRTIVRGKVSNDKG